MRLFAFTLIVFLLAACQSVPPIQQSSMQEIGVISGERCFPSHGLPPMTVYAREVSTDLTFSKRVEEGAFYSLTVPAPGQYIVFALADPKGGYIPNTPQGRMGGYYSCAALFSMAQPDEFPKDNPDNPIPPCTDPSDDSPKPVFVETGVTTENIYICDWYNYELLPMP